ncbi:class I SAM-dependent methyltransferase [Nitrogeniibacter mangrovi]|uniref:Class I SAM-dependent methyltransferase n=1 Tax=Nitrogeniibacter mangrovi TaxID=2016596 RepID=A0A6C1B3A3_9RHOO|nr:class I SAM-dependent methyltransferase [Nitrogeniibacter mangrovi]QID18116.1 class I SAM-dependent methyltransferase [Nitrogeniibacter mangrovi]
MSAPKDPKAFWESRYAAAGEAFVFGEDPNDFLVREAHRLPEGSRVLSVADGEGRNGVFLAQQGHRVEALEFAPAAIAKSRALARSRDARLEIIEADVFEWTWPCETYDAVVAIFVQFATPAQRARLFDDMMSALLPGGLLLLQGYTPKQIEFGTGGPSAVENLYTEALLLEAFADHETLLLRTHESVIDEGAGHRGMSALVDLVVRKL